MTRDELNEKIAKLKEEVIEDFPHVASILCTVNASLYDQSTPELSYITAEFSKRQLDKIRQRNLKQHSKKITLDS